MSTLQSSSPPSRRGRRRDRRQRFSNFLATLSVGPRPVASLELALLGSVPSLVPVRRAVLTRLDEGSRAPDTPGRLRLPVPAAGQSGLYLVVELDPERELDAWDRQMLRDAARVLGLVLSARYVEPMSGQASRAPVAPLIGSSVPMRRLRHEIERVADTDFTVLIQGESGSGKELVAQRLHAQSRRQAGPFVAVNCAALVESLLEAELFGIEDRVATGVRGRSGKFEAAHRGTLFLDEIADLSAAAQAKLLRAVQEREVERIGGHERQRVDIRLLAATNRRLGGLVAEGRFRADLYYRLAGVEIDVPPLRHRREDIMELAGHFLARHAGERRPRLTDSAVDALLAHDWPGNVRELQRVVERALTRTTGEAIGLDDLPPSLTREYAEVLEPSVSRTDTMRAWGSRYARLVLERCDRNKRQACEVLGISYHTLQSYLRHRPVEGAPAAATASAVRERRSDGAGTGG